MGHLTPFLDEPRSVPYFKTYADKIADAIDTVRRYREAVGNEVDLCLEIHRRPRPAEAVALAEGIEPYHPHFYEDPILPDDLDAMDLIAKARTSRQKVKLLKAASSSTKGSWSFPTGRELALSSRTRPRSVIRIALAG